MFLNEKYVAFHFTVFHIHVILYCFFVNTKKKKQISYIKKEKEREKEKEKKCVDFRFTVDLIFIFL